MSRRGDRALDTTHDVFVQLLRHRERLSGKHPSSLLFTIATRLSLNRLRDSRRDPDLPGDEILQRVARHPDLDAPLLLDRLFRRHPESTRTMAVLHYVDGMTLEQVGRECGLSVSGVRKRLRALRVVPAEGAR